MQARDREFMDMVLSACLVGRSIQTPAEWAEENFVFDEPNNHGPFRLAGNEYVIDVLNDFARTDVSDVSLVWGSQTKKTGTLMGGVAWCLVNDPCGFLWVMPNEKLAKRFSRQRLQKAFRVTEPIKRLIPAGAARHSFSTLEMILGGSVINLVGSNSAANLASNPCRRVIMDEVDKFNEGGLKEANAVNLAEQRTKDQVNPQRWKTSTPTMSDGLIWQEFLKGTQHRYFLPCPFCGQEILLAWSRRFTVLPIHGCEAWIHWDPAAKGKDGAWDMDKVKITAHALCPHCKGKIGNEHKTAMVRKGKWRATNPAAPSNHISRQLSSLYSTSTETTFGVLAVKFLLEKGSLLGLQGFINGDLAEPMENQDTLGDRIELVSSRVEPDQEGTVLMTVDCQAREPFFWWVVRQWKPGSSLGIAAGSANTWEELEDIQKSHGVRNEGVAVDSGYGARSDSEVYAACFQRSEILPMRDGLPVALGWVPTKGMPGRKLYRDPKTKLFRPFFLRDVDPFEGSSYASKVRIGLVGFSADYTKDILEAMRKRQGLITWSVSQEMATEAYWRHMDGEIKEAIRSKVTGRTTFTWRPRSKLWPNHLLDCEVIQVILASYLGLLDISKPDHSAQ